ncbi:MAG: hypothetical protein J7L17_00490 [Thaumarchaeota archaeon]|nr:hypothetical protein [Nitrososphaerota archaeon]
MEPLLGGGFELRYVKLIDSMKSFLMYWREYSGGSPEEMFSGWLTAYISNFPEFLIFEASYWRGLEKLGRRMIEKVFPKLDELIHDLIEVWMNFLQNVDQVCMLASERIEFQKPPIIGIYVGSGWKPRLVSSILDEPMLFIDLGGLASLGWIGEREVRGVIAFGLGQLHHAIARGGVKELERLESDPFTMLYIQGYAQFLGNLILGAESWHGLEEDWLEKCEEREADLAEIYLEAAERRRVEEFYDPEGEVAGLKLPGRYLGYMLVSRLREQGMSLMEISNLSEERVRRLSEDFLREMAGR